MPWGYAAAAVGSIAASSLSSKSQKKAAETASDAQVQAAQLGVDESRRQFDKMQEVLAPFIKAGTGALGQQQALIGLGGPQAQEQAIESLRMSPEFAALTRQGEEAILSNASATGGLRGGNVQSSLAQFRPALLAQLIGEQYKRLGGLTQLGQASAAGVGAGALSTGSNIAELLQQSGAAQAGSALAAGRAGAANYANIGNVIGTLGGIYASRQGGGSGVMTNELF